VISLAYQCCFCAGLIIAPGQGVRLNLVGMGVHAAGQDLFAHTGCLAQHFAPTLAAGTPFDAAAFESGRD
jgi:hypothetical protein